MQTLVPVEYDCAGKEIQLHVMWITNVERFFYYIKSVFFVSWKIHYS